MNVDYELLQRGCLTAREKRLKQELYRHPEPKPECVHCCKCGKADKRANMGVVGFNVYKCWECLAGIVEGS